MRMRKPGATAPEDAESLGRRKGHGAGTIGAGARRARTPSSPLRRLGEGLAPSRLAPAPFEDAEASRLPPLDRDDPAAEGFKSLAEGAKVEYEIEEGPEGAACTRRARRHIGLSSSVAAGALHPVLQASILSPTHRPGGACRGRAERRQADGLLLGRRLSRTSDFVLSEAAGGKYSRFLVTSR